MKAKVKIHEKHGWAQSKKMPVFNKAFELVEDPFKGRIVRYHKFYLAIKLKEVIS